MLKHDGRKNADTAVVEHAPLPRTQVYWLGCPNSIACYWSINLNWYVSNGCILGSEYSS